MRVSVSETVSIMYCNQRQFCSCFVGKAAMFTTDGLHLSG